MLPANAIKKRKKPVNLTIDENLLRQAKDLGINLSRQLEEALAREIQAENHRRWLDENRTAIVDYNDRIARNGAFSDRLRRF